MLHGRYYLVDEGKFLPLIAVVGRIKAPTADDSKGLGTGEWDEGIAQRVRAERDDDASWTRVLETIYWWPAREGKQWPATLVPIPEWSGAGAETDAWTHFETTLGLDDGYRWEPLLSWFRSQGFAVEFARSSITSDQDKFGMGVVLLTAR